VSFDKITNVFNNYDAVITANKDNYQPREMSKVMLYNPAKVDLNKIYKAAVKKATKQKTIFEVIAKNIRIKTTRQKNKSNEPPLKKEGSAKTQKTEKPKEMIPVSARKLSTKRESKPVEVKSVESVNNIVFRLFIWRDMLDELARENPIFGFTFGKPLRSISLEIIDWGSIEWKRDGWIAAHNSYLHMIYRAGVVGIIFILSIWALLIKMIKDFIQMRSLTGVLLIACSVYWLVAANFLLTFELPYTAIPFWSLFGMTFAYCVDQRKGTIQ